MLKKVPAFLFFLLTIQFTNAADTTQVKKFSRFYGGISFTPAVTHRIVTENKFGPDSIDALIQRQILNRRNAGEVAQFGFNAGIKAGFRVTRFFAVETGIEYSMMRYFDKSDSTYVQGSWNGSSYDTVAVYRIHNRYTYHYLNIPVALNFEIGKKKVRGVISTGVILNVFLTHKATSFTYKNDEPPVKRTETDLGSFTEHFVKLNISPFLAAGIDYYINDFLVLRVMPVAQIQAMKNIHSPITEHLWSAGVNCSLLYNFKSHKV